MKLTHPIYASSRLQVVPLLAQRFSRDYDVVMQQYLLEQQLDITQHLLGVLELFSQYEGAEEADLYSHFREKEDALLKKYGKTLQPYKNRQFHLYFAFDLVLAEKEIYSTETFNALPGDQQRLSVSEIREFIKLCHHLLYNARSFLYLRMEPETMQPSLSAPPAETPDTSMTKARQLLAIYYLLKTGFGVEHRHTHATAGIAKLAHLLTGTTFTTIQNSDIYKKYAAMPYYKKGQQLITDLQFIRPYFTDLQLEDAVKLIDTEIAQTRKQLSKY